MVVRSRYLVSVVLIFLAAAACTSDGTTANVPSGETREAGALTISNVDDIAQFDLSHAESLTVTEDGWYVTSTIGGYVTGDGLASNARQARVILSATVNTSDQYPDVLCFANEDMSGGYMTRFGDEEVTLVDASEGGALTELDSAAVDLTFGVSATVDCEYLDDGSVTVTVTDFEANTLLEFRDPSPDRREGRAAIRIPGASVSVLQTLHFSTTAA